MSALALAEAKQHLNVTSNTNDTEIQAVINAAESAISRRVGPLVQETVTARVDGRGAALLLPTTPAISLISVTPIGGTALTISDLYLSTGAGVVTYATGCHWFWAPAYDVVYTAGRTDVPDDLLMAIKELTRHLWTPQRGGQKMPGAPQSDSMSNTLPGAAYAFPFRVEQLIAPHERPGFA